MKKRKIWVATILVFAVVLGGCQGAGDNGQASPSLSSQVQSSSRVDSVLPGSSALELPQSEENSGQEQTATLYIGMEGSFQEYPLAYTGELTPELLIEGISQLTGWNLDLSEPVTTGKGGMTVSFTDTCALIAGPPDPQKEEFFVFDVVQLAETVLDSLQRTLQYNFVDPALGNPESLDIYFCLDGEDLAIPNTEIVIPQFEPYQGIR